MKVYQAINAVTAELAKVGISKDRKNTQGAGFTFRGIDDVLNALAPILASNGLCVLPRVKTRECVERISKSGGALFYTTIECDFDFVSTEDGSKHTVTTFGEAMDSGDKSTNKAMSAAYKYAALQAFCIPVVGTPDADSETHEVKPKVVPIKEAKVEIITPEQAAQIRSVLAQAGLQDSDLKTQNGIDNILKVKFSAALLKAQEMALDVMEA